MNHFANGAFHSRTLRHGFCQESSFASRDQNLSGRLIDSRYIRWYCARFLIRAFWAKFLAGLKTRFSFKCDSMLRLSIFIKQFRLAIVRQALNGKLRPFSDSASIHVVASPDQPRPFAVRVGRFARPVLIAAAYILPVGLIVHAITFWGRGIIDSEAMEFVLNYLQKRPFFAQIFDPQINDWGAYQARELSYVFDLIDARVFATMLYHQVLLFVPFSGVLGLIAVSAVYFWGARRVLGLNGVMASMLLSLFLSCIVVQASTPILYRSSKIVLSVALLAFFFYTFSLISIDKRQVTPLKSAALFSLGLVMALSDRQGFYYLISATIIVLMLWLVAKARGVARERGYVRVIFINAAAIGATIFYNRIFGPWLIHALNGYWPNFSYQNLSWSKLLDPTLPAKTWHLFDQQVSFFFGNIPFLLLVAMIVIVGLVITWKWRSAINNTHLILLAVSLVAAVSIIGLLAAMVARHPAVYSVRDHSFWYYTLSVQVVILIGVSVWLCFIPPDKRPRFNPLAYAVIAILIAGNTLRYRSQREIMIHSTKWFDEQYAHSQELVAGFAAAPPTREKLQSETNDLFLDDQAHFLENVERSYLHLTGASRADSTSRP